MCCYASKGREAPSSPDAYPWETGRPPRGTTGPPPAGAIRSFPRRIRPSRTLRASRQPSSAVAALARRLDPAASPARLGALLLTLLDGAASEGAVDFLWLSAGPDEGEPAVSHAFADAQHPRLFLNGGKLTLSELWEEVEAHCRLGPAALAPALGSAPAPLAPKHFAGGYALFPEAEEGALPYPRHRFTGPALAKGGEPMVLGPEGVLWGLTRRLSLHPLPPQPGLPQGAGYLLQEDGLAFEDHRVELPAFLAKGEAEEGP